MEQENNDMEFEFPWEQKPKKKTRQSRRSSILKQTSRFERGALQVCIVFNQVLKGVCNLSELTCRILTQTVEDQRMQSAERSKRKRDYRKESAFHLPSK